MLKLSDELLEKVKVIKDMDKEQQEELEKKFLEEIRDEESSMYSKFMSNMSDEYLLGMFRVVLSGVKSQIK